ncbi:ribonuclease H [Periconia macrospinosa]|uniref:ribonuclease H n=1 Tax=Periconia macrospinosa TaxID=97972 RepID=A0A2V1DSF2_9PLEO|nr:ribonuclease H [Periconia macrospinosa]
MKALDKVARNWPSLQAIIRGADPEQFGPRLVLYTDGSCFRNGSIYASAGFGVYIFDDHEWNASEPLPGRDQSNQKAELCAILWALVIGRRHKNIVIISDSEYAIFSGTTWREARKWDAVLHPKNVLKPVKYQNEIDALGELLDERKFLRLGSIQMRWVKGHAGVPGNEKCDELAKKGAQ